MKGYKAFNKDLTCRDFQYEIGKTYEMDGEIEPCERGFHFCKAIADCYKYYDMSDNTRICEIEAVGEVKTDDEEKFVTNKITIMSEVTEEWKRKGNASASSSGCRNSGNWNSGNCNSGDWNSGNRNSGDWNSGNRNSGNSNSGDWNSGDWNSGDWNSGDWNATDFSSGCFCTEQHKMLLFNKPSGMTLREFRNTDAYYILFSAPFGCYQDGKELKIYTAEDRREWWNGLSDEEKDTVKAMPNFDWDIFVKCMQMEEDNEH